MNSGKKLALTIIDAWENDKIKGKFWHDVVYRQCYPILHAPKPEPFSPDWAGYRQGVEDGKSGYCKNCGGLFSVTDARIKAYIEFMNDATVLRHPQVPYHGTENGDSIDQWNYRFAKAILTHVLGDYVDPDPVAWLAYHAESSSYEVSVPNAPAEDGFGETFPVYTSPPSAWD